MSRLVAVVVVLLAGSALSCVSRNNTISLEEYNKAIAEKEQETREYRQDLINCQGDIEILRDKLVRAECEANKPPMVIYKTVPELVPCPPCQTCPDVEKAVVKAKEECPKAMAPPPCPTCPPEVVCPACSACPQCPWTISREDWLNFALAGSLLLLVGVLLHLLLMRKKK